MLSARFAVSASLRWTAVVLLLPALQSARAADPKKDRLAEVLAAWEKVRRADRPTHLRFSGKIEDSTFGEKKTFRGEVFAQGGESLRIDLQHSESKSEETLLAVKGTTRLYDFKNKAILVGPTPPELRGEKAPVRKGFVDNLVGGLAAQYAWLYCGLPVWDFDRRFRVRLEKEDDTWIYLGFRPRKASGWQSDERWQIVLDRKTYRVRRVWWQMPNGNTEQVDFEHVDTEALPASTWEAPFKKLPEGWAEVRWTDLTAGPLAMPARGGKDKEK